MPFSFWQGLAEKFLQNMALMDALKATLVLADPDDTKWAVGLSQDDSRITNRNTWPGKNLLGEMLTEMRVHFMGAY